MLSVFLPSIIIHLIISLHCCCSCAFINYDSTHVMTGETEGNLSHSRRAERSCILASAHAVCTPRAAKRRLRGNKAGVLKCQTLLSTVTTMACQPTSSSRTQHPNEHVQNRPPAVHVCSVFAWELHEGELVNRPPAVAKDALMISLCLCVLTPALLFLWKG